MSTLSSSVQYCADAYKERGRKRHKYWEEKFKTVSTCLDDMTWYKEILRNLVEKLLDFTSVIYKSIAYKVNLEEELYLYMEEVNS